MPHTMRPLLFTLSTIAPIPKPNKPIHSQNGRRRWASHRGFPVYTHRRTQTGNYKTDETLWGRHCRAQSSLLFQSNPFPALSLLLFLLSLIWTRFRTLYRHSVWKFCSNSAYFPFSAEYFARTNFSIVYALN